MCLLARQAGRELHNFSQKRHLPLPGTNTRIAHSTSQRIESAIQLRDSAGSKRQVRKSTRTPGSMSQDVRSNRESECMPGRSRHDTRPDARLAIGERIGIPGPRERDRMDKLGARSLAGNATVHRRRSRVQAPGSGAVGVDPTRSRGPCSCLAHVTAKTQC